jgi:hypothetical protein
MKLNDLTRVTDVHAIRDLLEQEFERTGGIFRLAPTWVGRPGIVQPGRRIKLFDDYLSQEVAVNERWFSSVTYADNGVYNRICPEDHGLSYMIIGNNKVQLRDAIQVAGDLLLDGRKWDVLPKFFDNWHRIPHHMHPCQDHVKAGLVGKPESYYFPVELNMDKNASPATPMGVDAHYTDAQILHYLGHYFAGDNRLTDLANSINLLPGTGWFMPPCTLHAPGSLVTYELQTASDVSCIPESRVNDMTMPPDLIDRDLPVTVAKDGFQAVCEYMLSMIRCPNSGNSDNFRQEYFRPPVNIRKDETGNQAFIIYRCGKGSQAVNSDLYSAKRTSVNPGFTFGLNDKAAFGGIVLAGHGQMWVDGKQPVQVEAVSLYRTREELGGDEFFVAASAAGKVKVSCASMEKLTFHQHFASNSNPEATSLTVPEYFVFPE